MGRRLALAGSAVAALVLLTACNVASRVVVQPDGSGTYSVIVTVPTAASNPGAAIYQAVKKGAAHSTIPVQVTHYSAGGNSGAMTTFHFLSLADLDAESARLAAGGDGGIGVTINRDGTGWHFTANAAQSLITPPSFGGSANSITSPGGAISGSALTSTIAVSVIVTLPGAPGESNATSFTHTATATTFSWVVDNGKAGTGLQASTTFVGQQANVKLATGLTPVRKVAGTVSPASKRAKSSSTAPTVVGIAGGAVLLIGGGALIALRRKRQSTLADNGGAAEAPVLPD